MHPDLHQLAAKYGTDKGDGNHTVNGRNYLHVYDRYLPAHRETAVVVVEVGILGGASLRMWRDYFTAAKIWGLDNNPASMFAEDRIATVLGSQDDPAALAQIAPGCLLDVVIDDASHWNDLTLATFAGLWPRVRPGGLYFIEDLSCSYGEFKGRINQRHRMDELFNGKVHSMDQRRGDCGFIHFWPMLAVFEKAK